MLVISTLIFIWSMFGRPKWPYFRLSWNMDEQIRIIIKIFAFYWHWCSCLPQFFIFNFNIIKKNLHAITVWSMVDDFSIYVGDAWCLRCSTSCWSSSWSKSCSAWYVDAKFIRLLFTYIMMPWYTVHRYFFFPYWQLLNQIVCEFPPEHPLSSVRPLRELLGHTPLQVYYSLHCTSS